MTTVPEGLWNRALESLEAAKAVLPVSPNAAASRAYYAAFYAVSAALALQGRFFRKHSAVDSAVHRDFVRSGLWPKELGEAYSRLLELRTTGDYGQVENVAPEDARGAIEKAAAILRTVAQAHLTDFQIDKG